METGAAVHMGALIARSARDEDELRRQQAFFDEGSADPELAGQTLCSPALYAFVQQARAHRDAMDGAV